MLSSVLPVHHHRPVDFMVQRRIADLWRQAAADVPATVNWAAMYKTLLGELVALSAQGAVPDAELRARLEALITETQKRKPPSRASLVREGLIDDSPRAVVARRHCKAALAPPASILPSSTLPSCKPLYLKGSRKLPVEVVAPSLGMIWQVSISSPDRERAFQALEVATLFALRRAVRNGSVWIEHSLSFSGSCACSSRTSVGRQSPRNTMPSIVTQQGCHFLEAFAGQSNCRCRCGGRCSPQWRTARG